MKVSIKRPLPRVIAFEFSNRYLAASSFMRLQEFWESPDKKVKGKMLDLQAGMNYYAKKHSNKMTYFKDWSGFNVNGQTVLHWLAVNPTLGTNEQVLIRAAREFINIDDDQFCLVGYIKGDKITRNHEIAHAKYYLDVEYRASCTLIEKFSLSKKDRRAVKHMLKKMGYGLQGDNGRWIFHDELQAYCATNRKQDWKHDKVNLWKQAKSFRQFFKETVKDQCKWKTVDTIKVV